MTDTERDAMSQEMQAEIDRLRDALNWLEFSFGHLVDEGVANSDMRNVVEVVRKALAHTTMRTDKCVVNMWVTGRCELGTIGCVVKHSAHVRADQLIERCESRLKDCGPVEHYDADGVPLCEACWQALPPADEEDEPAAQQRPSTWVDTPLEQAKRRAFDDPTQANLDALIIAARAAPPLQPARAEGETEQGIQTTTLECPCCGDVAARADRKGFFHDGDRLVCGCYGWVTADGETLYISGVGDEPCPKCPDSAPVRAEEPKP